MKTAVMLAAATCSARLFGGPAPEMRHLYSEGERIVSAFPCEVSRHPYISDGAPVAKAAAGEAFGPLPPGSYLVRERVAPGRVRTRYLGVAAEGWTVVQMTVGSTGDKLDSVFHSRRVPAVYYVDAADVQADTTHLGWERDYGDDILLHLHPNSLGRIDPKFSTLKENWEDFTVPEIVERLRALDGWMQAFGFRPLRGFASYTPANSLVAAMREAGWDVLHSIIPEQNWSDGHWAINHWGMPNQPFYIASDDFRKSVPRAAEARPVLGMTMNSYHLYMPHVVMWGDNVLSPSHFLRWHRTVESGDEPLRFGNFLDDYLRVASGVKGAPYFLVAGFEFGRTFGTRSMTVHNRAGAEMVIDRARDGGRIVFATGRDVADWYAVHAPEVAESVFAQRDYLAGARIMDKPIDSGPSVAMEMRRYKACFDHLSPLPYYHYDYTLPWKFAAADVTAPADFAADDRRRVKAERKGGVLRIEAAEPLPRAVPVCLWDAAPVAPPAGMRVFTPPKLDDGREHTCIELPAGWHGTLELGVVARSEPDPAEFGGLVSPLWRVQTIGEGARRQAYVFLDTPLLSPCEVDFTVPRDCSVDSLERPLGPFRAGERVRLAFDTRRTWYRFRGLSAAELQPDAAALAAVERAAAEWRRFADDAGRSLAEVHARDDAFFRSAVPAEEKLLLDVDCFGNSVFGERSRARPFDRVVFAADPALRALEYSDGGVSRGRGRSSWVHPRRLNFQVEGLDALKLGPGARIRVRLATVADEGEELAYHVQVRSGWKRIFGCNRPDEPDPQDPVLWNCPHRLSPEGLFTFDVAVADLSDGVLAVGLQTAQKQILDDWFADGGFIARLDRVVVSLLP